MKRVCSILLGLCCAMGVLPLRAQLPEEGTAENPKWYYIQVRGEGERADRVFTAVEGTTTVYGRPVIVSSDMDEVATQLWRFEQDGSTYNIVNMATGKSLDVAYDAEIEISKAILSETSSVSFKLNPLGDWYQIESTAPPAGGIANEVYFHQANTGGNRNYAIMMVNTTWSNGVNSSFKFVPFEDFRIEYSTDDLATFYQLVSAKSEYAGLCMTEETEGEYALIMKEAQTADFSQQWMVKKKSADGTLVELVNRATGHTLQNTSNRAGVFNLPVLGSAVDAGNGWSLSYLGNAQYTLSGEEEDGIVRYLNASSSEADAPEKFDEEATKDSGFGWKFRKVDVSTGIQEATSDVPAVRVENGRIWVDGTSDYRVYTLDGKAVSNQSRLMPGIYIVNVGGTATKVIVY